MKFLGKVLAAGILAIVIVGVDRRLRPLEPVAVPSASSQPGAVQGQIVSIRGDAKAVREAVVKLDDGQTVRASVPPACAVFEGEATRLERRDGATYWIVQASGKKS